MWKTYKQSAEINTQIRQVVGAVTITNDDYILEVTGAATITLPAISSTMSWNIWVELKIINEGAFAITIAPVGSDLINGQASYTFSVEGTLVLTALRLLDWDASFIGAVSTTTTTEVSSATIITRALATDALATTMTITPVSWTYLVISSWSMSNSLNGWRTLVSIYSGGVRVANSERQSNNTANQLANHISWFTTQARVTVNGSQAIELQWKTNGTWISSLYARTLSVTKVA